MSALSVTPRTPLDETDPGFTISGHKLRWVSGIVQARRGARIWKILKLDQLPKDIVEKMKVSNPSWMDGDTIRRGDLTLSYAPMEEVEKVRGKNKADQELNESVFKGKRHLGGAVKSEGSSESKVVKAAKGKKGKDEFS